MKTQIIYEDEDLLVVKKPAGMATQSAGISSMDVESELRGYLGGGALFVVHRLDQPVEGILVFARNKKAAASLSAQSADGRMQKIYHAILCGHIQPEEGTLVNYLEKTPQGLARVCEKKTQTAKKAVLDYKLLRYDAASDVSYVEIHLQTGRFHQIRIQMSHAGFPLVGDRKYGSDAATCKAEKMQLSYVALKAFSLSFEHPSKGEKMTFCLDE